MMVPQPAGGTMDSNGRALASYLEQALGRDIVIANIKPE
jgi:tripartite-type tricarboxylate transporter receptor subunit TctC